MTESEFLRLAEATLDAIEAAVDATGLDIEPSRAGNVLTLECPNGSSVIVNTQLPTRQIWVAARSGGFHYQWLEPVWRDTRDGSELFAALEVVLSAQTGQAVALRQPVKASELR